jgi:hypothetical protein
MGIGASLGTKVADPAYWVPASLFKRADGACGMFPHTVTDRAKPGIIAVNSFGKRFVNEASSYHEFVRAMLHDGNDATGRSFYLICDRAFLWSYGLGRIHPALAALCGNRRIDRGAEHWKARRSDRRRNVSAGFDRRKFQRACQMRTGP